MPYAASSWRPVGLTLPDHWTPSLPPREPALMECPAVVQPPPAAPRRAARADPLREEAHYDLMRLYAAAGQPSATLHQYQELERLLRDELGETPSAATRALAEELRQSARTVVVARSAVPEAAPGARS